MGKPKDSSKNRKWEQIRRDRLNQTFSDLCKELPSKTNGGLLSKKAILVEALAFIQQLQKEKKELHDSLAQQKNSACPTDNGIPSADEVRTHITILLRRQSQLVELLQNAGIAVPPDGNAEQVSAQWSSKIFQNGALSTEEKDKCTVDPKKTSPDAALTTPINIVHRVVLAEKTKPMNPLSRKSKEQNGKRKMSKKSLSQAPLVLQSLPPQLVLTPGSAPAAVPVIVSVAGVKTMNPVIVVQSKPLIHCNTVSSFSARPIRPCPAVRPVGTKSKVPIPALKPKANSPAKKKVAKVKGKTPNKAEQRNDVTKVPTENVSNGCAKEAPVPESANLAGNNEQKDGAGGTILQEEVTVPTFSEVEPKRTAWSVDKNGKRVVGESIPTSAVSKRLKAIDNSQNKSKDLNGYLNNTPVQNSAVNSSPSKSTPKSGSYSISALCSLEQQNQQEQQNRQVQENLQKQQQNQQQQKTLHQQLDQQQRQNQIHQQQQNQVHQQQQNLQQQQNQVQQQIQLQEQQNHLQQQPNQQQHQDQRQHQNQHQHQNEHQHQNQQQHLNQQQQQNEHERHQNQQQHQDRQLQLANQQQQLHQNQLQQQQNQQQAMQQHHNKRQEKKQQGQQQSHLQQVNQQVGVVAQQSFGESTTLQTVTKPSYVISKMKEVYVPSNEQYLEWVEKSGSKSRIDTRTYSYNSYSSPVVHNSRNTFMPITENEVFDGTENAFGLPLNAPDMSSDLFTSLQVPNGGQHSESISPTAAFLLTFPLVSTSKTSELMPDETACDNSDSQSGMKTILQIGNIDNDASISKNIFNVTEEGLNNFALASQFSENANSQKENHVEKPANKDCTSDTMVFKEASMMVSKSTSNALDQSGLYFSKNYQLQLGHQGSKQSLQTSSDELQSGSHSNVAAAVGTKTHAPAKCLNSDSTETQKLSGKERKNDRSVSWNAATSQSIPLNPFGDFVTNSSLNYPALPSSIISSSCSTSQPFSTVCSQPNVTSSFSIAQTSSNLGILSWSTLPSTEEYVPSRNNPKLARFHDIFPYRSSGNTDVTSSVPTSYVSNVIPSDPKIQTTFVPVSEHNFFQEPSTSSDTRSKSTNVSYSSGNSVRSRSNVQFDALNKTHFSSNSTSKQTYDQETSQYTLAATMEGKQSLCSQDNYDKNNASLGQYPTMYVQSKQPISSITSSDAFSRPIVNSGKHFGSGNCAQPKETQQRSVLESSVSVFSDLKTHENANFNNVSNNKKSSLNNIHHSSKEKGSVGACSSGSESRLSQCNQPTDCNNVPLQQKGVFKPPEQLPSQVHKQMSQKGGQKQYQQAQPNQDGNQVHQQQEQSSASATLPCSRSSKTTMSIHRPPVNWMTAPDIRSSLQNSPAFGNNQFYIPDHQRDADGAVAGSMFDTTNSFHCLDLPHAFGQSIYKSSDLQLLGNDQLEGIHESAAWSPSKTGNNSVLGSMLIPSTLPTLVGDLALGDSSANISRPFLPTVTNESSPCSKKSSKRSHSMKTSDDGPVIPGGEFSTNFLSVSQLVDTGVNRNKGRLSSLPVNRTLIPQSNVGDGPCYPVSFPDQDIAQCPQPKQSSSKCPSSSYSAEALLSNSAINSHQINRKKRSSNYNNYTAADVTLGNLPVVSQSQCNFVPDLSVSRSNDLGGLPHPETMPAPFMLPSTSCNTSGSHRNSIAEDESQVRRGPTHSSSENVPVHLSGSMTNNKQVTVNGSNTLDVGVSYESNFPPFLPPVSVGMTHHPYSQDALYTTPRFQMHSNANNHNGNVQSPSANTLTNFHLSTIFPEINGKVLC